MHRFKKTIVCIGCLIGGSIAAKYQLNPLSIFLFFGSGWLSIDSIIEIYAWFDEKPKHKERT